MLAESRIGLEENGGAEIGLYISLLVLPVLAQLVERVEVPPWQLAAAAIGLILMSLTVQRSVLVALAASVFAILLLAGRGRRLQATAVAIGAMALSVGGAIAVQATGLGTLPPGLSTLELQGVTVEADPDYLADDALTAFRGGATVTGDAALGSASRQITRDGWSEIPEVRGLVPGRAYTIVFWVKPLLATATYGRVGDTSGRGWSGVVWRAAPVVRWQRFQKQLRANSSSERLVMILDGGAPRVRFDGVQVLARALPDRSIQPQPVVADPEPRAPEANAPDRESLPRRRRAQRLRRRLRLCLRLRRTAARCRSSRRRRATHSSRRSAGPSIRTRSEADSSTTSSGASRTGRSCCGRVCTTRSPASASARRRTSSGEGRCLTPAVMRRTPTT